MQMLNVQKCILESESEVESEKDNLNELDDKLKLQEAKMSENQGSEFLSPRKIRCKLCTKTFHRNCELELHMEEHEKEKEFKCDVCDKGFYLQWR